jgi:hypothetical protein
LDHETYKRHLGRFRKHIQWGELFTLTMSIDTTLLQSTKSFL